MTGWPLRFLASPEDPGIARGGRGRAWRAAGAGLGRPSSAFVVCAANGWGGTGESRGANGPGSPACQQLAASGEQALDVQPTLGARTRLVATGAADRNDATDARSGHRRRVRLASGHRESIVETAEMACVTVGSTFRCQKPRMRPTRLAPSLATHG
jgi:hypothetical protein